MLEQNDVPDPATHPQLAECVRHGRGWKVTYAGESVVVGHLVGMLHIAVLLANPLRELASASGLSGRARTFTDNQERARISVGKAIRRAIMRIEHLAPAVGAHLAESIYTGVRCVYQPA